MRQTDMQHQPSSVIGLAAGDKPAKRSPDPTRRSERSRTAVLDAARVLLSETGYSSVTIDQISARARVSKATVYRWWPSKASIFMDLYNDLATQSIRPMDTGSLQGDLRHVLRGAFQMLRTTIAGVALAGFIAEAQANPDVGRLLREKFAANRRRINLRMLERARLRGEIPVTAPLELISDMITGTVYYGVLTGMTPQSEESADLLAVVIVAGVVNFRQPEQLHRGIEQDKHPASVIGSREIAPSLQEIIQPTCDLRISKT